MRTVMPKPNPEPETETEQNPVGRPPKGEEVRDGHLNTRVPLASKGQWTKASRLVQGQSLTDWLIKELDAAAARQLKGK